LETNQINTTNIYKVYAHTCSHTEEEIESFYETLNNVIRQTPRSDIKIIKGDWNAKVGPDAFTE